MRVWRLDAPGQTLVLACRDGAMAEAIYWGLSLPEAEDLAELARARQADLTGGMLDRLPPLSICPLPSQDWQGQPGLVIAGADPKFRFARDSQEGARLTLQFEAEDLSYRATFTAHPTGIITAEATLESKADITVHWLSAPVLPGPQTGDILDFHGRWIGELQPVRQGWTPGIRLREARSGRSGHEHPPLAYFPAQGTTQSTGRAHALHYGWSGGHRMMTEELPDGRRQIQFGHATGSYRTGRSFRTGALHLAVSEAGLNGCATAFQRDIRDRTARLPDPARPRPVHYNCWEAVYFDHDLATLCDIADRAAALGAERFVLDDGWFARRDDDTTSLGDWQIDPRKWPEGLGPLIDHVEGLGLRFGLWFEPEMINADSALYRAHPDWVLGPAEQTTGRHQLVLDMSRAEVRDHLFAAMDAILSAYAIDYVKWDHNRLLPIVDAAQAEGTYALFDRLIDAHPGVEWESCASGGGRIDAGILARCGRVWLSDSNDALERLRMQHDAALWLPAAVTGSHVGPRRCHTSGRILPMSFRARVAAQRHMGFEMDLRELTEDEATTLRSVTGWWKDNRDWMMGGAIHRIDSADPAVIAEMQIAADGARFVVFAGQAETSAQTLPRPLQLAGLEPSAFYEVALLNPEDAPPQSRGDVALRKGPLRLTGRALMEQGILLPVGWPATMWMVDGTRLPAQNRERR